MKTSLLMFTVAPLALMLPGLANAAAAAPTPADAKRSAAEPQAEAPAKNAPVEEAFTTGVAKGRDRLDSATSTSALKQSEIQKLGARTLADILRNIPGIRTESSTGDGNSNYTIRGLPLTSGGSKYMQIEEDGLPVL